MKTKRMNGMKAILKLAVLTTFILSVVSCSTEAISEIENSDLTATAAKAKKPRPIKNTYVGVDRFEDGILVGADFSGNMSHAGKITGQTTTADFYFFSETQAFQSSDDVIVTANGDEIYTASEVIITFSAASIADCTYSEGIYTGGFDIVGGTGRFDGATGRMEIVNHGVFNSGISEHNAAGTITY